jgi:hypothetical protein
MPPLLSYNGWIWYWETTLFDRFGFSRLTRKPC